MATLFATVMVATAASGGQWSLVSESTLRLARECAAGNDDSCRALVADQDTLDQAYVLAVEGPRALIPRLAKVTVSHRDAITLLRIGTTRFPRDAALHYELAQRILNSGLNDAPTEVEAYGPLLRAVELKPDYAEALETLGSIELELGQAEVAAWHLRAALHVNPRLIGARLVLADAWPALRRPREAADEYRVILGLAEGKRWHRSWATAKLAELRFWLGDGEDALKILGQPVEGAMIDGSDVTCTRAVTLWWLGRDDEARHECKLAIEGALYCNCQGRVSADATVDSTSADDDVVMRAALSNNPDLGARDGVEIIVEGTTAFSDVQIHPVTGLKHRFESRAHQYDDEARVIEAADDLLTRSRVPVAVNVNTEGSGRTSRIRTLSRREMRQFVTSRASFFQRFPDANGFVTVSRPGFSKDQRVAVIAVQKNTSLCSGGPLFLFVLDRQGESWALRTHGDNAA